MAEKGKILVVDDDSRIRDLLRRYLSQEGFEVFQAEDGKALNRILLRETVDLTALAHLDALLTSALDLLET